MVDRIRIWLACFFAGSSCAVISWEEFGQLSDSYEIDLRKDSLLQAVRLTLQGPLPPEAHERLHDAVEAYLEN